MPSTATMTAATTRTDPAARGPSVRVVAAPGALGNGVQVAAVEAEIEQFAVAHPGQDAAVGRDTPARFEPYRESLRDPAQGVRRFGERGRKSSERDRAGGNALN